mmetsp:Transcript_42490/g.54638  ORF Transcript_42490/g.54638 Transcript_42490/m.54638 type:complete len:192 (+) Transcript_42490:154-729(+)
MKSPLLGWFFWNFKMETNVYEEWDFLYGLKMGWMPHFKHDMTATEMFGSCQHILDNTENNHDLIDPFPPASWLEGDDVTQLNHNSANLHPPTVYQCLKVAVTLIPLMVLFWALWLWSFRRRYLREMNHDTSFFMSPDEIKSFKNIHTDDTDVIQMMGLAQQETRPSQINYGSIEMGNIPQNTPMSLKTQHI